MKPKSTWSELISYGGLCPVRDRESDFHGKMSFAPVESHSLDFFSRKTNNMKGCIYALVLRNLLIISRI